MNVMVTGCNGTIGVPLVNGLVEGGYSVFGCDLGHEYNRKFEYIKCDISNYRELERIFNNNKIDVVFNLAAEFGRWNGEDYYERLWNTNVVGLKHLLNIQKRDGFKLIHFSSSEVYGDYDDVMRESVMDNESIMQLNDYAISKRVNEIQIQNHIDMFGVNVAIVRLFNVYGPNEYYSKYRSFIIRFIYSCLTDTPMVIYKGHSRSCLYIDDCISTLIKLLKLMNEGKIENGDIFNIGSIDDHPIEYYVEVISNLLGKSVESLHIDFRDSEIKTAINKLIDISKASSILGHRCNIDIINGLEKTIKWAKNIYKL